MSEAAVATAIAAAATRLPPGATFTWGFADGAIALGVLNVPRRHRREGHARRLLDEVARIADLYGLEVGLVADPTLEPDDPSGDVLVALYEGRGFETVGRDESTGGSPRMLRLPVQGMREGHA